MRWLGVDDAVVAGRLALALVVEGGLRWAVVPHATWPNLEGSSVLDDAEGLEAVGTRWWPWGLGLRWTAVGDGWMMGMRLGGQRTRGTLGIALRIVSERMRCVGEEGDDERRLRMGRESCWWVGWRRIVLVPYEQRWEGEVVEIVR